MVFEHAEPDSKIGRGRGSILSKAFVFVAHIMFQLLCEACLLASVSCEHFSANFSGAFAIGAPLGHLLPYLQTLGLSHKPHFPARHTDILYPQEGRGHPRANSPTSNFLPTLPVQNGLAVAPIHVVFTPGLRMAQFHLSHHLFPGRGGESLSTHV